MERISLWEQVSIRKLFSNAYNKISINVKDIEKREFGVGDFGRKIVKRHISFSSIDELHRYLINNTPIYISYSSAYYNFPSKAMEDKGYIKSDFVIDIDESLDSLDQIKPNLLELYDIFKTEMGLKDITINYSGNRGFHIHIRDDWIQELSKEGRAAILDYLNMSKLDINNAEKVLEITKIGNKKLGVSYPKAKNIMQKRILKELKEITQSNKVLTGDWSEVTNEILALAIDRARFKVDIDNNVTLDTSKLLRMENSIHGDTGFLAKILNVSEVYDFNPWYDAVLFESIDMKIRVKERYNSKKYGIELIPGGVYKVKGDLGVFLILQGKANLISF